MGFGEAYQGMEVREILIEVATKQDAMMQRQEVLERKVDAIQCPSPRCQDHAHRLGVLMEERDERKSAWGPRTAWAIVALTIAADVIAALAWIRGR